MTNNVFQQAIKNLEILKAIAEMAKRVSTQWIEDMEDDRPEAVIPRVELKPILKWVIKDLGITKGKDIEKLFNEIIEDQLHSKATVIMTDEEAIFWLDNKWGL